MRVCVCANVRQHRSPVRLLRVAHPPCVQFAKRKNRIEDENLRCCVLIRADIGSKMPTLVSRIAGEQDREDSAKALSLFRVDKSSVAGPTEERR